MTDLESFKAEIRKTGVTPEGVTLCNCEVSSERVMMMIIIKKGVTLCN